MDNAVKVIVIRQPALCMLFLASLERHPLLHLLFDLELCLLRSSFLAHIIPLTIAAPKATASCHYPPEPDWLPTVLYATVCYCVLCPRGLSLSVTQDEAIREPGIASSYSQRISPESLTDFWTLLIKHSALMLPAFCIVPIDCLRHCLRHAIRCL